MGINSYEQALQQLVEKLLSQSGSHGIQVHVDSPKLNVSWSGAAGFTDRVHNPHRELLAPEHPMRIASNSKTFVAAAILRLWEEHQLELDASISHYISSEHSSMIRENGYALDAITARHLLTHTSGLFDYADSQVFADTVMKELHHNWTRTEQIRLAMCGEAYGKPGEVYRYSDTGYILLGEIVERVYGESLGKALRQLLSYKSLGLITTWLEKIETPPAGLLPLVHQYDGKLDSYAVDASMDIYGGGGLVSTVGDLSRFMRGLFTGKVYKFPDTLKEMLTTVKAERGGPDAYGMFPQVPGKYCLGIDGGANAVVFSHSGYFGTYSAYVPSRDLAIGLSVNCHGGDIREKLIQSILAIFSISL